MERLAQALGVFEIDVIALVRHRLEARIAPLEGDQLAGAMTGEDDLRERCSRESRSAPNIDELVLVLHLEIVDVVGARELGQEAPDRLSTRLATSRTAGVRRAAGAR